MAIHDLNEDVILANLVSWGKTPFVSGSAIIFLLFLFVKELSHSNQQRHVLKDL